MPPETPPMAHLTDEQVIQWLETAIRLYFDAWDEALRRIPLFEHTSMSNELRRVREKFWGYPRKSEDGKSYSPTSRDRALPKDLLDLLGEEDPS